VSHETNSNFPSTTFFRIGTVAAILIIFPLLATHAQWRTQQVTLNPGWNAVYLEVQPEPSLLDLVFTNSAVQSVWKWDRRFSHIQYVIDPYTLLPEDPHWLVWLPTNDTRRFLSRLFELQGDQAYLIKVATNAAPFSVPVKGGVIIPQAEWFPHGLNLKGFPVHPNNPPTFSEFFRFTPEVDTTKGINNQLFRINSAGRGVTIVLPRRDKMAPGQAYWVGCARDPKYMGPLHVVPQGGGAVDFGTTGTRQDLTIYNILSTTALVVRVTQEESEPAPEGFPELAGPVPLSYMAKNASNSWEWHEFPATGLTQTVAAGGSWPIYLGVRRQDFPWYIPSGTNGYAYQSILKIEDAAQSLLIRVPVVAQPQSGSPVAEHHENEGLWVGAAVLDHVNAPAYEYAGLMPTPAPASLRLIVHVDGFGRSRLLQQVLLAWDSSLTNAPHTNGTYALFVNDADVPADAKDVHRISSVAFPLMPPLTLTGEFTNILTGTVTVRYDDPTNPFLHRFHPLHDNRDWDFNPYTNAVETRTIVRHITLDFDDPPTNVVHHPYWGVDQALGTYEETLTGLRAQPIVVKGSFWLERISRINELQ